MKGSKCKEQLKHTSFKVSEINFAHFQHFVSGSPRPQPEAEQIFGILQPLQTSQLASQLAGDDAGTQPSTRKLLAAERKL